MTQAARWRAEAAFAAMFFGVFFALAAQIAFLPVWYAEQRISDADIGLMATLGIGVRIFAGVALPAASDRTGRPGAALAGMCFLGALAAAAHLAAPAGLLWLGPLALALGAAFAGAIPVGEASCWASAERLGFSFRRPRAIGSAAFLLATLWIGALMGDVGADAVIYALIVAFIAAGLGGLWIDRIGGLRELDHGAARPRLQDGLRLLKQRRFAAIVAAAAMIQASHAVVYVYGSVHWRALGFSETVIGALWSWGVACEIALFAVGGRILGRLGAPACLTIGGAIAALRWAGLSFDPGVLGAAALQTLHAGSFALTHLAAVGLVASAAPPALKSSAQGVMSAASGGAAMTAGALLASALYPAVGGGAYWAGAAFAAIGVVIGRAAGSLRAGA